MGDENTTLRDLIVQALDLHIIVTYGYEHADTLTRDELVAEADAVLRVMLDHPHETLNHIGEVEEVSFVEVSPGDNWWHGRAIGEDLDGFVVRLRAATTGTDNAS